MMAETETLRALFYALEHWDDIAFQKAYLDHIPYQTAHKKFFTPENTIVSHDLYHDAQKWDDAGYPVLQKGRSISEKYDFAALFPEKDKDAALFQIKSMLQNLNQNGEFIVVAHNDAGGKRLAKWLQDLGCAVSEEITKYHCRAVKAKAPDTVTEDKAQLFYCGPHGMITAAGIFGADKIDSGSAMLRECLPATLSGKLADFGCGYGYLAQNLAQDTVSLFTYDNDWRAVEATRQNVPAAKVVWWDLSVTPIDAPFDAIIMNPPFHEGKGESVALGQKMIETASGALRKGGKLFMVANRHLPYEKILSAHFSSLSLLREEKGFKVYEAIR